MSQRHHDMHARARAISPAKIGPKPPQHELGEREREHEADSTNIPDAACAVPPARGQQATPGIGETRTPAGTQTLMAYSASSSFLNSTNPKPWCTPVTLSLGMCTFATGPAWIMSCHETHAHGRTRRTRVGPPFETIIPNPSPPPLPCPALPCLRWQTLADPGSITPRTTGRVRVWLRAQHAVQHRHYPLGTRPIGWSGGTGQFYWADCTVEPGVLQLRQLMAL